MDSENEAIEEINQNEVENIKERWKNCKVELCAHCLMTALTSYEKLCGYCSYDDDNNNDNDNNDEKFDEEHGLNKYDTDYEENRRYDKKREKYNYNTLSHCGKDIHTLLNIIDNMQKTINESKRDKQ